jgi:hypothetical protein
MAAKDFIKEKFGWDPGPVFPLLVVVLLLGASIALSLLRARPKAAPGSPS